MQKVRYHTVVLKSSSKSGVYGSVDISSGSEILNQGSGIRNIMKYNPGGSGSYLDILVAIDKISCQIGTGRYCVCVYRTQ